MTNPVKPHRMSGLTALLAAAVLAGCASGVTRMDAPAATGSGGSAVAPATALADRSVKAVSIQLSEGAKKLVPDNIKFNPEALRSTVERTLATQGIVKPDATQQLDIEITSFRTRSNFSAIMFGIMAGTDNVEGIVTVKGGDGRVVKRARINASYGLGGFGGGQDDARMNWLYEEFAKLTLAEISGAAAK